MKFSIIVPVYNAAAELPACVQSILAQTCPDFELILVDDGSKDGSGALCDALAREDSRIRVLHKSNGGAASARNAGMAAAAGQWLLFIDGDDTLESDCLAAIPGDGDLTVFGMAFDYADGRTERLVYPQDTLLTLEGVLERFETLFSCNALSSACNKCFRGELLRSSGLSFREGMTLYEDLDFVLRYLPLAAKVRFLPQCFYHYRLCDSAGKLNRRVAELDKLSWNLQQLGSAMLPLGAAPERVFHRLCAQLLYRHFLCTSYSAARLQPALEAFGLPLQPELLQGAEREMALLAQEGRYGRLHRWLARKKLLRRLRSLAKALLRK